MKPFVFTTVTGMKIAVAPTGTILFRWNDGRAGIIKCGAPEGIEGLWEAKETYEELFERLRNCR